MGPNTPTPLNDAWALSFAGSPSWSQLAPSGAPPAARYDHGATYDGARDRMLVFGGANSNTGTSPFMNDTWSLSLGTPGGMVDRARRGGAVEQSVRRRRNHL
jgi:hypothetical protein